MVWSGLTKPIKLGLKNRKDQNDFGADTKQHQANDRIRLPGQHLRGWSGRAWPGKHVGPPQTQQGGRHLNFPAP